MLGFGVEALARGASAKETCEYPLLAFVAVQIALIVFIQILAPMCLIIPKNPQLMAPALSLTAFAFQWVWLLLGWVWAFSPSNCEFSAPYLYSAVYWLVVAYSITVPLETLWYIRIYYAASQAKRKPAGLSAEDEDALLQVSRRT
jgi:hypothetical protein